MALCTLTHSLMLTKHVQSPACLVAEDFERWSDVIVSIVVISSGSTAASSVRLLILRSIKISFLITTKLHCKKLCNSRPHS